MMSQMGVGLVTIRCYASISGVAGDNIGIKQDQIWKKMNHRPSTSSDVVGSKGGDKKPVGKIFILKQLWWFNPKESCVFLKVIKMMSQYQW